jgi:HEAT repeat protein
MTLDVSTEMDIRVAICLCLDIVIRRRVAHHNNLDRHNVITLDPAGHLLERRLQLGVLRQAVAVQPIAQFTEWESVSVAAIWAVGLLALGIAVLGSTIHRRAGADDMPE